MTFGNDKPKNVYSPPVGEDPGEPCWNCQKRSRYGTIIGEALDLTKFLCPDLTKFLCPDCSDCPRGQQYALSSANIRNGEPVFPPAVPPNAITRWKLENQNFDASYGSAGVVGLVWSCTVLGKRMP